ncbi:MAG: zinc-dependent metalloprotease [Saprospiraceae bacterium]|nr:zinc-dependent metalloprotease [Saprospiraceae bacterium]MCF8251631.1 zinc-dependent metalloprotease [Saprospiraceae bacterium]MCF8281352.1 zinc-dependent metalloprotease [Bacteroidales bacterium]MCF8312279.1 zinc-dependent metalloprotease [Saprospiraceae bacterium]MCF8441987.1 zinc-dependent metalloprotease [Saprospiraceae bacterium]
MHELGHVFGLFHTFNLCSANEDDPGSPCLQFPTPCNCGDFVSDSSFDPVGNGGYFDEDCTTDIEDAVTVGIPLTNIMSYYPIPCREDFTDGQRRRMKRYLTTCPKLQEVVNNVGPIRFSNGLDITIDINGNIPFPFPNINPCLPGFIVEPDATLNLASNLQFNVGRKILVKPGGRVNVKGVALTGCGDEWEGIEVEGNTSLGQIPTSNQGRARLYPNSTIEDARTPLRVRGGGLVTADATLFSNCGAVIFHNYAKNNLSRFTDCQFLNDDMAFFPFINNVQLTKVLNVGFTNCTFSISGLLSGQVGTTTPRGISALNARFAVSGGTFTGYYNAIRAYKIGSSSLGYSVNGAHFTDNFKGIENWNMDNATLKTNTFTGIGNYSLTTPVSGEKPTGIELRNCTSFIVNDNNLTGSSATNDIGILAYDTGSDVNILRRNTFSGLNVGNQAELDNRGSFPVDGLQYWCNTNSSTQYDFAIFDEGIGKEQGTGLASKNVFSYINSSSGDYKNESSGLINYYYRNATNEIPLNYLNITPIVKTIPVICTDTGKDDKEGVLTGNEEGSLVTDFNTTQSAYQSQLAQYNSLPNGSAAALALEPELAAKKSIMHRIANVIIRSELLDTVSLDLPKIRTWLRNKASKESEYAIVETWLSEANFSMAEQVLDSIPIRHQITGHALTQHQDYEDWVDLWISLANQEKDMYALDSTDIALVQSIADNGGGLAAAQTQGLLNALYGADYRILPKSPTTGGGGLFISTPPSNGQAVVVGAQIEAYPNPAKGLVNFSYKLNEEFAKASLDIYDVNGRMVARFPLQAAINSVEWKTDGLASGVYYYKTTQIGGADVPKKLVLIK